MERLTEALASIDAANAEDPNTIFFEGSEHPKELLHARLMTDWVLRLHPEATEAQLLAARAHHLRRWVHPRTEEAPGRAGYLRWRSKAKERHAREVATILERCGYEKVTIERVQQIIRKQGLRPDPRSAEGVRAAPDVAVQAHEDALCLVFLQTQLDSLADELGEGKVVEVLRKTLRKMSDRAKVEARSLDLGARGRQLVALAVGEE